MATNYPTFQSNPTLNSVTASSGVSGSSGIFNSITGTNISAANNLYVGSNLGVGTTATTYKLDVAGTGRFTSNFEVTGTVKSTSTIYAPGIDLSSSTGYANIEIGGPSGGHIDLKRPYTDDYDIRLISDNNIEGGGYLLTSGGAMLSLSGSGVAVGQYSSAGYKFLVGGTTRLANTVEIGQSGTLSLYDNATQVVVQYPNKQVSFYDSTNTATRMLIDANGNVGIGTTNPAWPLQVGNESGQQIVRIAGGSSGTAGGSAVYLGAGTDTSFAVGHYSAIMGGAYNDTFTLYAASGRNTVFSGGGNVGIGTSTPAYKLDVAGTGRFTSNVEITGTLAGITGLTSSGDILVNGLTIGRGKSNSLTSTTFGISALSSSNGFSNSAFGYQALTINNNSYNSAFGSQALQISLGSENSAFGRIALFGLVNGNRNTVIGTSAGSSITNAQDCVIIGCNNGSTINNTTGSIIISDGAGNIRIQANNTGLVTIPGTLAVSGGIQFPATMASSSDPNTLDDYEEGSWTPQLTSAGGSGVFSYLIQHGRYTKLGNKVLFNGTVVCNGTGSRIGEIQITNLPFTIQTLSSNTFGNITCTNYTGLTNNVFSVGGNGFVSTYFALRGLTSGSGFSLETTHISSSSNFSFNFYGFYNAA